MKLSLNMLIDIQIITFFFFFFLGLVKVAVEPTMAGLKRLQMWY